MKAKSGLPHGEWLPWLEKNFEAGERTAERYMRLAKKWDLISENRHAMSNLPYEDALKLIAKPRQKVAGPLAGETIVEVEPTASSRVF